MRQLDRATHSVSTELRFKENGPVVWGVKDLQGMGRSVRKDLGVEESVRPWNTKIKAECWSMVRWEVLQPGRKLEKGPSAVWTFILAIVRLTLRESIRIDSKETMLDGCWALSRVSTSSSSDKHESCLLGTGTEHGSTDRCSPPTS